MSSRHSSPHLSLSFQGKRLPAYLSADAEEGEVSDDDSADEIDDDFKLKSSNVSSSVVINILCVKKRVLKKIRLLVFGFLWNEIYTLKTSYSWYKVRQPCVCSIVTCGPKCPFAYSNQCKVYIMLCNTNVIWFTLNIFMPFKWGKVLEKITILCFFFFWNSFTFTFEFAVSLVVIQSSIRAELFVFLSLCLKKVIY